LEIFYNRKLVKFFALLNQIRDKLTKPGVTIEDSKDGALWR